MLTASAGVKADAEDAKPKLDLSLPHLFSSPESLLVFERQDSKSPSPMLSPSVMYKMLIPLLRCEVSDISDSVVQALGNINHNSLMDLLGEKTMQDYIRESLDRKLERRRRRNRDMLRCLRKIFCYYFT